MQAGIVLSSFFVNVFKTVTGSAALMTERGETVALDVMLEGVVVVIAANGATLLLLVVVVLTARGATALLELLVILTAIGATT